MSTETLTVILVTMAVLWPATLTWLLFELNRRHRNVVEPLRRELSQEITQAERWRTEVTRLKVELSAAELRAAISRPPNPMVEWLALKGSGATTDQLTDRFGPAAAQKAIELLETQEISCTQTMVDGEPVVRWRWRPPSKRQMVTADRICDTVEPPRWLPQPDRTTMTPHATQEAS